MKRKKFLKILKSFLMVSILAAVMSQTNQLSAQLSGTKTLGSGGDYTSWSELANAISGNGLSGDLTIEVVSDLSSSSSIILRNNASSPTSSSKKITIDGKGLKLTSDHGNAALILDGMDYLTLKDYTIVQSSTSTNVKGIQLMNGADYNTIDKCTIYFSALTVANTSTSTGGAYVVISNSSTSLLSSSNTYAGSYNSIQNCKMYTRPGSPGPTAGIFINGSSSRYSSNPTNNTVNGNTIENFHYYGVYTTYTNGDQVINNDISRANSSSNNMSATAMVFYSTYTYSTSRSTKFEGNHVHDLPFSGSTNSGPTTLYGVYSLYNIGNSTHYFTIEKNRFENIYSTNMYAGYNAYTTNTRLVSNEIHNWRTAGFFYGWWNGYNSGVTLANKNGIYDCFSTNISYGILCAYGSDRVEMNDNVFKRNKFFQNTTTSYTLPGVAFTYLFQTTTASTHKMNFNIIDSNDAAAYYSIGAFTYYADCETSNNIITNNTTRVENGTAYSYWWSIWNYYVYNNRSNNNLIAENRGYYGQYGMYMYSFSSGNYKLEVRDNTIQLNGRNSPNQYNSNYGMYVYCYYHNDIRVTGNLIDYRDGYYTYPVYTYAMDVSYYKEWSHNNYWVSGFSGGQYWYNNNGGGATFADWQNTGLGKDETTHFPIYEDAAKGDYRTRVYELQNKVPLFNSNLNWQPTQNTFDLPNKGRNLVRHDHGAIENFMNITGVKSDASIPAKVCSGYEFTGDITIRNNFVDTIYGFNITMATDRGARVTQTVANRILPGNSLKVNFTNKLVLNAPGVTKVMVFVDASDDNLNDDTIYFTTEVLPAPGGGFYRPSSKTTQAFYQLGRPNEVTILKEPVIYDVQAPTKYSNSTYGTKGNGDWYAEAQALTASGRAVTGASVSVPSGSTDMEIRFVTTDATLEDSILTIVTRVIDNNNDCDTFIRRNVLIYPSITPLFAFPKQICEGEAVLFENNSKVASGGMEFVWDFGTGISEDKTDAPEPVFQFPGSKTYKVKLSAKTVPYGFTFDTTMDVTVNPIPTVGFTKVNACDGDALVFTNNTTPTNASMKWSFGDNTTATSKDATKKYSKPGQYNVTLEADLAGCVARVTQKVYQFARPVANFDRVVGNCDNDMYEFTNKSSISSGLIGSMWDFNDNGSVSTEEHARYDFSVHGDKRVKLVVTSEFGCKDSMTKTINVKESPKVAFTNGPLCSVKPTSFINTTGDVVNAIANYRWDFGDGNSSNAKSPTHNWKGNLGPKKVSLKVSLDNGCEETLVKDMVVLTQPNPDFVAGEACSGEEIAFINNTTWPQGKISYRWDFGDGTSSSNSDPVKIYNSAQSFYPNVTLYAFIEGGCGDSITKTNYVLVNEKPRTCDFVAEVDYSSGFYGVKVEPINSSGIKGGQSEVDYIWVFEGSGSKKTSGLDAIAYNNLPSDGGYQITMKATMRQSGCECISTKSIVMNRSSIDQVENIGVMIYPNPNTGKFQVVTSESFGKEISITLMDVNGRVIMTQNHGSVDESGLSSGIYLLKVSNKENSKILKIKVQK
jgi:PKD repeat protein